MKVYENNNGSIKMFYNSKKCVFHIYKYWADRVKHIGEFFSTHIKTEEDAELAALQHAIDHKLT